MLNSTDKIIKHKTGLLNLAEELGNVSKACQVMGMSRDTFYRYKSAVIVRLIGLVEVDDSLPALAKEMAAIHFEQIAQFTRQIDILTGKIKTYGTSNSTLRRLQTMPGVGPIGAMTIETFAPDMATFRRPIVILVDNCRTIAR